MTRVRVTGDDFGLCEPVDRAICELHDQGVLHRAALLATSERFAESCDALRARPQLEVGLHLNLTDGRPVLPPERLPSLVDASGRFPGGRHYRVLAHVLSGRFRRGEIREEWRAQIQRVRAEGIEICELNSHGHLHLAPNLWRTVAELAREFSIPAVRLVTSVDSLRGLVFKPLSLGLARAARRAGLRLAPPSRILGLRGHGWLSEASLARALGRGGSGAVELIVHPSLGPNEHHRRWQYSGDEEVRVLLSPRIAPLLRSEGELGEAATP